MEAILATIIFLVCAFFLMGQVLQIVFFFSALNYFGGTSATVNFVLEFFKKFPIVSIFLLALYAGWSYAVVHIMLLCWPLM